MSQDEELRFLILQTLLSDTKFTDMLIEDFVDDLQTKADYVFNYVKSGRFYQETED